MNALIAVARSDLRVAIEVLLGEEPNVAVIGSVRDAAGLLALIPTARPGIVVFEWGLAGWESDALPEEIWRLDGKLMLIALCDGVKSRQHAIDSGVDSAVVTGELPEQLLGAVRRAAKPQDAERA